MKMKRLEVKTKFRLQEIQKKLLKKEKKKEEEKEEREKTKMEQK